MSLEVDTQRLERYRKAVAGEADVEPVRLVFAAAHVVMLKEYAGAPHSPQQPGSPAEIAAWIDWDATQALRVRLDTLGLGVAEAMDTAQRFAIGWPSARRLIESTGKLELANGFIAGASYDNLEAVSNRGELVDAVAFQVECIQDAGGIAMILPLPWLVEESVDEAGYVEVYRAIIGQVGGPLFVHWLGEVFHPGLAGYFPGDSVGEGMALAPDRVRGAKLSLLDPKREQRWRRELLPRDQIILTGDDLNFARLILGGDSEAAPIEGHTDIGGRRVSLGDFSHGLLGILDAIAEPAGLAFDLLARGDAQSYLDLMLPCEELSRHVFAAPTLHYKAGLAFLAWLNGLQSNPMLANHEERTRDREHYLRAAELAAAAGALNDAELASERLGRL